MAYVCVCVCVYVHACVCVFVHMCVRGRFCTWDFHYNMNWQTNIRNNLQVQVEVKLNIYVYAHRHTHARTHTRTHTHTHTHTHTLTYTHPHKTHKASNELRASGGTCSTRNLINGKLINLAHGKESWIVTDCLQPGLCQNRLRRRSTISCAHTSYSYCIHTCVIALTYIMTVT